MRIGKRGWAPTKAREAVAGLVRVDYETDGQPVALTADGWLAEVQRADGAEIGAGAGLDVFTIPNAPAGSEWVVQLWGIAERTTLGAGSSLNADLRGRNGGAVTDVRAVSMQAGTSGSAFGNTSLYFFESTNAIGARSLVVGVISCVVTTAGDVALNFTSTVASGRWKLLGGLHLEAMRID